jgi:hypothetical protein
MNAAAADERRVIFDQRYSGLSFANRQRAYALVRKFLGDYSPRKDSERSTPGAFFIILLRLPIM